ncbi:MAG: hypothetical protein WC850_03475 [Candidatus Gracilibacteria bacterium]
MLNNKKATILIYVIVLISIVMMLSIIVLNNSIKLENTLNYQTIKSELSKKIKEKGAIMAAYDMLVNSDGSGFIDNISCPDNVTMSGETILTSGITTTWANSGTTYICSGSYNGLLLNILSNTGFTSFDKAIWGIDNINLTDNLLDNLTGTFPSYDSGTLITIPYTSYKKTDGIDDNFNDDNYIATYNISDNIKDNDDIGRITIIGYVKTNGILENIFWNNEKTNQYIANNTNNVNNSYINIGTVNSGSLHLNINNDSIIKVVKFDKAKYTQNKELSIIESFEGSISAGSGYIEKNLGVLSLNTSIGPNTYNFDFQNNDYAIFVRNNGIGVLNYKITGIDLTISKPIYLSPLNDSYPNEIKVLSSYIIIDSGIYIGKQSEYIKLK